MKLERFLYKGDAERYSEIESALLSKGIGRKEMYMILKYFEINPDCEELLQQQYPDV